MVFRGISSTKETDKNVAEESTRDPANEEDFEKLLKIEELLKEKKEAIIGQKKIININN